MARIVKKFGGTSVADLDRIRAVAARVKESVDAGDQVAVVVSAMAGETNRLVDLVSNASALYDARGNRPDTIQVRHRRSAEFLDNTRHSPSKGRRRIME